MKKYNNTVSIYLGMDDQADASYYTGKIQYILPTEEQIKKLGVEKYYYYAKEPQPCYIENKNLYRVRSEIIIMDGNKILVDRLKSRVFPYSFPGGGIDKNEDIIKAASRECEEEALIIPKNVEFVNIAWYQKFPEPLSFNFGAISLLCVGQKHKDYKSYVRKKDRDEFADQAEWISYKDINLGEPHALAIQRYLEKYPVYDFSNHLYKR